MTTKIPTEYDPSKEELDAADEFFDRQPKIRPPRLKVSEDSKVEVDHPDKGLGSVLLMRALGTTDTALADGILKQVIEANSDGGRVDEAGVNFTLSVIVGVQPKDPQEVMMAAMMAQVCMAAMKVSRRATLKVPHPRAPGQLAQLAQAYNSQIAALDRHRKGPEQKITVQHVTVGDGGQAVVANFPQTSGASSAVPNAPSTMIKAQNRPTLIRTTTTRRSRRRKSKSR